MYISGFVIGTKKLGIIFFWHVMLDCGPNKVIICVMLDHGRKKFGGFCSKNCKKSIRNAYILCTVVVGKSEISENLDRCQ